jgi:peptide deformylase
MELASGIDLASLKILKYPDPRLRGPCGPVREIDEPLRRLVRRMFELMYAAHGVGLAAPQLGIPLRVFVINPGGEPGPDECAYVNPEIVDQDGTMLNEEGCLSFPGISCKVKRRKKVVLRATDLQGAVFQQTGEDLLARIFQHEMDHIDGILLMDRMSLVARMSHRRDLKELEDKFSAEAAGR